MHIMDRLAWGRYARGAPGQLPGIPYVKTALPLIAIYFWNS